MMLAKPLPPVGGVADCQLRQGFSARCHGWHHSRLACPQPPLWWMLSRDMNENLSLGRIAGIHVCLNWSLLVVAALIAWSLATGILPSAAPGYASGAYWTAGAVSAAVFLASLLAHELAHSIV